MEQNRNVDFMIYIPMLIFMTVPTCLKITKSVNELDNYKEQ